MAERLTGLTGLLTYEEKKLHDGVEDVTVVRLVRAGLILSGYLYQPGLLCTLTD